MQPKLRSMAMPVAVLASLISAPSAVGDDNTSLTNPADVSALVSGNNRFALDLSGRFADQRNDNVVVSPYSISNAFAMAYAGARGQTAAEMEEVFHFDLPSSQLHGAFGELVSGLNDESRGGYTLSVANRLWGQQGFHLEQEFLDVTGTSYGAPMAEVDFVGAAEPSRQTINDWVADQTQDRIQDFFPQGSINQDTRLVLTNAIYLDADWAHPFDAGKTRDATFTVSRDEQMPVPMMHQTNQFGYASLPELDMLEMPYAGEELSMLILLPRSVNGLDGVQRWLNEGNLSQNIDKLQPARVSVSLPKFQVSSDVELGSMLAEMGMPTAFGQAADFSGITGSANLYIQSAIHQSFIAVDELGTEAAAATGIGIGITSIEIPDAVFRADHPFAFMIRDLNTESILFTGQVVRPELPSGEIFGNTGPPLMPGDADRDLDFDQADLVHVLAAAKYLTGKTATWGEGDWNAGPGGRVDSPPVGDGVFDQFDIIAAQQGAIYLRGPYAAVLRGGQQGDGQTSVGYDAGTGEVWLDAPADIELTSINIDSVAGIFTGAAAGNLGGSFDNDSDGNIFKATFGSSFASLSFGRVAEPGLEEQFVASDLAVIGSLAGGGGLGDVDLIYVPVPEPRSVLLAILGCVGAVLYIQVHVGQSLRD